jgi:CheY-like chemotaxis protein
LAAGIGDEDEESMEVGELHRSCASRQNSAAAGDAYPNLRDIRSIEPSPQRELIGTNGISIAGGELGPDGGVGDIVVGSQVCEQMKGDATLVSVVDDDESVRESLPALLKELGFASKTFASAKKFLESSTADKTHCLILDIAMPGMSGPDLRRELVKRGYSIPTIFISGHAEFAAESDVRAGAVACLVKPFSDSALLESLRRALDFKRTG